MKISPINNFKISNIQRIQKNSYPNLAPLKCDMVSFGAMKKTQFEGFDLFIINKFKAPIEKFNSSKDLQDWCREQTDKLSKTDLGGRQEETTIQRKATFKEWSDYVLEENDAYTNSMSLLILNGILKDIEPNNDTEIPPLNKGILAQTIDSIGRKLKENPKAEINFNKEYRLNLQNMSLDNLETKLDTNKTGWVLIPSQDNDPEHFEENVDKLKSLSHKNWCTASFNARPYLEKGDFHIYFEEGRPKLGVRFVGDEIAEIQGEKNDSKIPPKYLDIAQEHTKGQRLSITAEREFSNARIRKARVDKIKEKLKKQGVDFKTCSARQLFDAMGIEYTVSKKDGLLKVDEYEFDFDDMGINIDENRLFREIKAIMSEPDFRYSNATNLGNLQNIWGSVNFQKSGIKDLGKLKMVLGNADFRCSKITTLGNLREIWGNADFNYSEITDIGKLKYVKGNVYIDEKCGLKRSDFKNVKIKGYIYD